MTRPIDDLLQDYARQRTDHIGILAQAILDTRHEFIRYQDNHQTRPRIETLETAAEPETIARLISERESFRHDFIAMSERAAELTVRVAELERELVDARLREKVAMKLLDAMER